MPECARRPEIRRRSAAGQSLVEFALVAPIFFLVFLGTVQFGLLFGAHIGLINAVREAARYGSLSPTTEANAAANSTAVGAYMRNTLLPQDVPTYNAANLGATSVSYCYYPNPGTTVYSVRLTVSASYKHPLFIPLISAILDQFDGVSDGALRLTTMESFRVENPPLNLQDVNGDPTNLPACP